MTPSQVYSWFRDADHLMKWLTDGGWRAIGYRKVAPGEQFVANSASPSVAPQGGSILDGPFREARVIIERIKG